MEAVTNIWFIAFLFFLVALAYSSVGLGGGSSYTALMAILGFSAISIPMISLTLNVLVTSIGSYQFLKNGHGRIRLIAPFLLSSIPMAYVGGALQLPKLIFYVVLLVSLLFVALRIYFWKGMALKLSLNTTQKIIISVFAGAVLGLIAGIAGIGGGIYLVPLILILGLGTEKQAAACGAIFIWLNSSAGLISRWQYNSIDLMPYLPMLVAVIAGGWLGSKFGAGKLSNKTMDKILGVIILVAIVLLAQKIHQMIV